MNSRAVSFAVFAAVGCAPSFPYARVVGPGRFELACPGGFPECAAMAGDLCTSGYSVEGTKSGVSSHGATVQCVKPQPVAIAPACEPKPASEVKAVKPACSADYNCTEPDSRCVDGACVVIPSVAAPDEADKCMIGRAGSSEPVPMFPTEGALADYLSSNPESRAAAFMNVTRLDGLWIDVGVRCRTLGQFERGSHVQLISGRFAGREGWVYSAPAELAPAASK